MTTQNLWKSNERRLLCYLKINVSKSREYLESENFRIYILSNVSNPMKQISLNLSGCEGKTYVNKIMYTYIFTYKISNLKFQQFWQFRVGGERACPRTRAPLT
jgi:hypothetical protein